MKKYNDTYSIEREGLAKIGSSTIINSESEYICNILSALGEGTDGCIGRISFLPFDDEAKELAKQLFPSAEEYKDDAYLINIESDAITVYSNERGAIYAATQIAHRYNGGIALGAIYNIPLVSFRACKTYIPGRNQLDFYRSFINACVYYGFNALVLEVGGAMEYKRHPEINEGWEEYTAIFQDYIGKSFDAQRCMPHNKDSIHWENGGGSYLLQSELRELIAYARERGIDVIPEVPTLSHSDYLLTRHPELAENAADPIPDSYCPLHPDVYKLVFDVIDEVIEVFEPKIVHIAHDEWYSACMCDRCRKKDAAVLFADDVKKIHEYITSRGIEVMMWADMAAECTDKNGNVRGSGMVISKFPTAKTVEIKGRTFNVNKELWCKVAVDLMKIGGTHFFIAPNTKACIDHLPKDIIMMNWLHHYEEDLDLQYIDRGMRTVYGNFYPRSFKNWFYCINRGVDGASISNWSMFDLNHTQRMGIFFSIAYSSMMMWNRDFDENLVNENTFAAGHDLFEYQRRGDKNKYTATIIHGSRKKIDHPIYWDGVTIDYDHDRMGYYRLDFEDGTHELRDIYYGCNIGVIHRADYDARLDPNGTNTHILEPIYTCDYERVDDEVYYKLVLSSDKKITGVTPIISDEYAEVIEILSVKID